MGSSWEKNEGAEVEREGIADRRRGNGEIFQFMHNIITYYKLDGIKQRRYLPVGCSFVLRAWEFAVRVIAAIGALHRSAMNICV